VSLYPNPTTDYLYIQSDLEIKEIQISDLNGRMINNLDFAANKLNLSALQTGIYFAKISDVNGNITIEKIIKK
jgi:hypothetical protein